MKLGFADCAYARWRSMYELCCNAAFIKKHGEIIAKQYVEQSQTDEHKYSWTKGAKKDDGTELKITTFQGIQDNCDVDEAWKKQYKLACCKPRFTAGNIQTIKFNGRAISYSSGPI